MIDILQGAVEQIAMQSPKELTALIEELSKSCEKREEYENRKAEMQKAELDAQDIMSRRRDVALEKREARAEKEMAKNYTAAREELAIKQRDLYLAQIFAAEEGRRKAQVAFDSCSTKIDEARERKAEHDAEVAEKSRHVRTLHREADALSRRILGEVKKVDKQQPEVVRSRQEVEHCRQKIDTTRKVLTAAKRKAEEHKKNIEDAEQKLTDARARRDEYVQKLAAETQQRGLTLNAQQLDEYKRLKAEAEAKNTLVTSSLYNLQQAQQSDRGIVEHETRRHAQYMERVREKQAEVGD